MRANFCRPAHLRLIISPYPTKDGLIMFIQQVLKVPRTSNWAGLSVSQVSEKYKKINTVDWAKDKMKYCRSSRSFQCAVTV